LEQILGEAIPNEVAVAVLLLVVLCFYTTIARAIPHFVVDLYKRSVIKEQPLSEFVIKHFPLYPGVVSALSVSFVGIYLVINRMNLFASIPCEVIFLVGRTRTSLRRSAYTVTKGQSLMVAIGANRNLTQIKMPFRNCSSPRNRMAALLSPFFNLSRGGIAAIDLRERTVLPSRDAL
jgi:hypothetical protein